MQEFSSDMNILMLLLSQSSFINKTVSQVFEILIFSQYILANTSDKSLLSPEQNNLKEI